MRYWVILILALVFFAVCFRSVQGETLPGTPIRLEASGTVPGQEILFECTVTCNDAFGKQYTDTYPNYVIGASNLLDRPPVCPLGAVRDYEYQGQKLTYLDSALFGCLVAVPVEGSPLLLTGRFTNRGHICSGGKLYEIDGRPVDGTY